MNVIMMLVFFIFAIALQGIRGDDLDFIQYPKPKEFCDVDVFIASKAINNKVFLIPGDPKLRLSDWYGTVSFCAQHCADAVTIHSVDENTLFINFARINGAQFNWLGAKARGANAFTWAKPGEIVDYTNELAGQFANNEICVHTSNSDFKWWTQPCNDQTIIYVACQRPADWKPCE